MRILLLSDGPTRHTRRWSDWFVRAGHEVVIGSFRPFEQPGAKTVLLPTLGLGKVGYLASTAVIRRLCRDLRPDVINAHYATSYGFLAALAGVKPLVVTVWGSDVIPVTRATALRGWMARFAFSRSVGVTVVAEHMRRYVPEKLVGPLGVKVIFFGVDTGLFRPSRRPLNRPVPIVICTRNFRPIYDVACLIRAFGLVREKGSAARLVLVGDGPLHNDLEQLARRIGGDIHFAGYLEHEELARRLREADVFVSPAMSDGNNVSLTEAMASGCFPVATTIPANEQWIDEGRNGFLFPQGDDRALAGQLDRALRAHDLRRKARLENRRIIEERAKWENCAREMVQFLERAAESVSRRASPADEPDRSNSE